MFVDLHIFLNLKFLAHANFVIILKSHLETNQVVLLCFNIINIINCAQMLGDYE